MGTVTVTALHQRTHPTLDVEGCFGCHAASIQFGNATGSQMRRKDREFAADQDAYKRLRADGLQPNSPQGAAQVERAQMEQIEIDYRKPLPKPIKEHLKEVQTAEALAAYGFGGVNA